MDPDEKAFNLTAGASSWCGANKTQAIKDEEKEQKQERKCY